MIICIIVSHSLLIHFFLLLLWACLWSRVLKSTNFSQFGVFNISEIQIQGVTDAYASEASKKDTVFKVSTHLFFEINFL